MHTLCIYVHVATVLTCIESVQILQTVLLAESFQTIICDLQHEAAVHHAVGRLQVAVGDYDAVVNERHSLSGEKMTLLQ